MRDTPLLNGNETSPVMVSRKIDRFERKQDSLRSKINRLSSEERKLMMIVAAAKYREKKIKKAKEIS